MYDRVPRTSGRTLSGGSNPTNRYRDNSPRRSTAGARSTTALRGGERGRQASRSDGRRTSPTRVGTGAASTRARAARLGDGRRTSPASRRAQRHYASHRYHYGHRHRSHLYGLLGLSFCYHLGAGYRDFYTYDPYYCRYTVGYGWNHYHWRTHFYHPLNYAAWWYPSCYTYQTPTYIYVNDRGDYSPYPSTVIVNSEDTTPEKASPEPEKESSPETIAARHTTLGDFYFKEGRYQDSAESYLRAIAYAPEDATLHFVLADALFAIGDYHYAAFSIRKAIRLDPAMAYAEADKRKFYGKEKDFDAHLAKLRKYLESKPFDGSAHLVLAYNLKFSGEPEGAIAGFNKVLELTPESEAAKLFAEALTTPEADRPMKDAPAGETPVKVKEGEKAPAEKTAPKSESKKMVEAEKSADDAGRRALATDPPK